MNAQVEMASTQDSTSTQTFHYFPGYQVTAPPLGAVALCGAVRKVDRSGHIEGFDHPAACVVCAGMAGA